jgi:hypothetical protein
MERQTQESRPPNVPASALPPANESVTPQSSKVCVVTVSIIYLFTWLQLSACLSNYIIDWELAASRRSAGLHANSLRRAWAWRSGINSPWLRGWRRGEGAGRAVARDGGVSGTGVQDVASGFSQQRWGLELASVPWLAGLARDTARPCGHLTAHVCLAWVV